MQSAGLGRPQAREAAAAAWSKTVKVTTAHPTDVPKPELEPEAVDLGCQRLHAMREPCGIRDGQAVLVE